MVQFISIVLGEVCTLVIASFAAHTSQSVSACLSECIIFFHSQSLVRRRGVVEELESKMRRDLCLYDLSLLVSVGVLQQHHDELEEEEVPS